MITSYLVNDIIICSESSSTEFTVNQQPYPMSGEILQGSTLTVNCGPVNI